MPDIFAETLGKALAQKITGKKDKPYTPETIFQKRALVKVLEMKLSKKDPKVGEMEYKIAIISIRNATNGSFPPERIKDILEDVLIKVCYLIKYYETNPKYWSLYGLVNEIVEDIPEAKKGYDIALQLDPTFKKPKEQKKLLKRSIF